MFGDTGTTADDATNKLKLSDAFVFFGQFIDHDVGISPVGAFADGAQPLFSVSAELFSEQMPIKVPANDPVFTGPSRKEFLPFERTIFRKEGGIEVKPRQLLNSITSFLDLSQVIVERVFNLSNIAAEEICMPSLFNLCFQSSIRQPLFTLCVWLHSGVWK